MRWSWDDCDVWAQAQIIAYNEVRQYEEADELMLLAAGRISR